MSDEYARKLLRIAGIDDEASLKRFEDAVSKNLKILEELLEAVDDEDRPF